MEEFLSLFERVSSTLAARDTLLDQRRLIGSPASIRPNESHGFCNYQGVSGFIHFDVYRRHVLFAVDIAGKYFGRRVGARLVRIAMVLIARWLSCTATMRSRPVAAFLDPIWQPSGKPASFSIVVFEQPGRREICQASWYS
jgi:hypothetical protein